MPCQTGIWQTNLRPMGVSRSDACASRRRARGRCAVPYNQMLSERRANAVQRSLLDRGVASDRSATRGFGENFPVAANDTTPNRQMNRRVESVLSDDTGKITAR